MATQEAQRIQDLETALGEVLAEAWRMYVRYEEQEIDTVRDEIILLKLNTAKRVLRREVA